MQRSDRSKLCWFWGIAFLFVFSTHTQSVFGQSTSSLILNEILADPAADLPGDANGDGTRDTTDDEFIELVNTGNTPIDLSGWTVSDAVGVRHTFAEETSLAAGAALVLFGGGTPTGDFGGAVVLTASTGQLSLNNTSETITIHDVSGAVVLEFTYGSEAGNDQSISRDPDLTGNFTKHSEIAAAAGALFSPGTQVDGNPFGSSTPPANQDPVLDAIGDQTIELGKTLNLTLNASDGDGDVLNFTAENLPSGATFLNQIFQWTPTTSGVYSNILFTVEDGNGGSDSESITITVTEPVALVLNEILADPAADLAGDANGDGTRDTTDDEFIELVNTGNTNLDLSEWTVSDATGVRHRFTAGTILQSEKALVLFGGGTPTGDFGGATVLTASSGQLSLNNTSETITIHDASGAVVLEFTYGSEAGNDQSISRDPDLTGDFTRHSEIAAAAGALFSPGTQVDGSPFGTSSPPANHDPVLDAIGDQTIELGKTLNLTLSVSDDDGDVLNFTAENLPSGATFLNQIFQWTPTTGGVYSNILFTVEDGNGGSDSESIIITVTEPVALVLNEILADPAANLAGDANYDGTRDTTDDEFIELVNTGNTDLDLSEWTVSDATGVRHIFTAGTILQSEKALVLFGGGTPTGDFGGATVLTASSGQLGLNNTSETITIHDATGAVVLEMSYGSEAGDDQSISRNPDLTGDFTRHSEIAVAAGALFSPGTKVNGSPFGFVPPPVNHAPVLEPIDDKSIDKGDTLSFQINAADADNDLLTYSAQNLPQGATFIDHEFFWTPGNSGTFNDIIFMVEDGKGGSDVDTITIVVEEPLVSGALILNEYFCVPGNDGDANNDGTSDAHDDQFIEFLNSSHADLDISGYRIYAEGELVHEFANGTRVPAQESVVVFGGGNPRGYLGLAGYNHLVLTASSGALNLQTHLSVFNATDDKIIDQELTGSTGVSFCRSPELTGVFKAHNQIPHAFGSTFSPGYHSDGATFKGNIAFYNGEVYTAGSRVAILVNNSIWNAESKEWRVDVRLKNRHEQSIFIPLYLRIRLQCAPNSGVSVSNPDISHWKSNDLDGDYFIYNRFVGQDFFLTQGETSGARSVRISNPSCSFFSVRIEVFSLDRHALAKTSSSPEQGRWEKIGEQEIMFEPESDTFSLTAQPEDFTLSANYPNPFSTMTTLLFALPDASQTEVDIFDILGRKVRQLSHEYMHAGVHEIKWNGIDQAGKKVPAGVYFMYVHSGQFKAVRRVVVKR
ncbi:lamin tail domain-containing protein [candidate division KSB1 bacterium]|nr:lamin tail domain-containing protein [candidate division KSB1 bacterium]